MHYVPTKYYLVVYNIMETDTDMQDTYVSRERGSLGLTLASLSKRAKRSLRILTSSSGSHVVDKAA